MKGSDAFIISLAEQISPDEVDTAPAILALVEKHGRAWRREYDKASPSVIGGWTGLATSVATIPDLITALQENWHYVEVFLEVSIVSIHVTEISRWIREWRAGKTLEQKDNDSEIVVKLLQALKDQLLQQGIDPARSTELSSVTVDALATNPNAAEFVQHVRPT